MGKEDVGKGVCVCHDHELMIDEDMGERERDIFMVMIWISFLFLSGWTGHGWVFGVLGGTRSTFSWLWYTFFLWSSGNMDGCLGVFSWLSGWTSEVFGCSEF